ncbi:hypothetical protein Trydic_g10331 [Trypoxylus dichotomus]
METLYTTRFHGFPNLSRAAAESPLTEESMLSLLIVLGSSISLVGLVFAFITYSQADNVLIYLQYSNDLHTNSKTRSENILTRKIPYWINDTYGDIKDSNTISEKPLIGISTNKDLKVEFRMRYQQFWLQKDISVAYLALWTITRKFLNTSPSPYLVGFSAVINGLTNKDMRCKSLVIEVYKTLAIKA